MYTRIVDGPGRDLEKVDNSDGMSVAPAADVYQTDNDRP